MSLQLRDLEYNDIPACREIVAAHWGEEIADQAVLELQEMFTSNSKWPPHYFVVTNVGNGRPAIFGFGGFKSVWMMSNTYELIWVNVAPWAIGHGVGKMLTEARLDEIRKRGGNLVMLMTQKPAFFEKFQFQSVANFSGWVLMANQLGDVTLDKDRSV